MPINIIKQVNWLDIFVLIILIRICYVSVKSGFPVELFKFSGLILAVFLSLHYYTRLSALVSVSLGLKNVSLVFLSLLSFVFLASIALLIVSLLRKLFFKLVKIEAVSNLNKWGGLVIGIVRAFLFASLIIFVFVMSGISYLQGSVASSYSGKGIFRLAPQAYGWMFNGVVSKFCASEKFNQSVLKAEKGLNK